MEIQSIKRRAPPTLIRTRRLANGEVVRTRAGPGILGKAKEVRESMKKARRRRASEWVENAKNDKALLKTRDGEATSSDDSLFMVPQVSSTFRAKNSKVGLAEISESEEHEHRNDDEYQSQNAISSCFPGSWVLQPDNPITEPDFFAANLNKTYEHFPSQLEASTLTIFNALW